MCHWIADLCTRHVSEAAKGLWRGAYLDLEEVLGRSVQLLEGLLARIWYRLHGDFGVIV